MRLVCDIDEAAGITSPYQVHNSKQRHRPYAVNNPKDNYTQLSQTLLLSHLHNLSQQFHHMPPSLLSMMSNKICTA